MLTLSLRSVRPIRRLLFVATLFLFGASLLPVAAVTPLAAPRALASHTAQPTSVTIAGSFQNALGCPGDWAPDCAATHLSYDAGDDVWQGTFNLPAGSWEYKAALNDGWDESYGLANGSNVLLSLGSPASVKFYYSHGTHWVTSSYNSIIATVPGSFQSEIGCPGDWQPDCLRSWLQDPDGDGTYSFSATDIPAGHYEAKAALNESWDVSYGPGGVINSPDNYQFDVIPNAKVNFSWDSGTHVLTISQVSLDPTLDNNVEWEGLRHDSRSTLYRTPGGAVEAGTPVTLRFRTLHNDVSGVKVRLYSVDQGGQQIVRMTRAASGVDCYQASLAGRSCDFWQTTIPATHGADNLWYRFIVTDGTDTDYYADDTAALDGGPGAPTDDAVDQSWALMLYQPGFTAPSWAKDAVIYQIFPDRFRNGRANNDPQAGDVRYGDPVVEAAWGAAPEGYCRNYAGITAAACPWRYGEPAGAGTSIEQPRGRDYAGGDLRGVDQQLDYLKSLGITTIYFNPIFDSASNHGYDTQDYTKIDPYFGTLKDWQNLVKHATDRGMRIVLDGVFNHLSSDSPFFDRYHHYATVGACESVSSPFRSWFLFQEVTPGTGTCAGTGGPASASYTGWFGFDSIPVIDKAASNSAVWSYFLTGPNAIAKQWLQAGASGWRMDVAGDASFPANYWETFRQVVKATRPDALTISETWQKDSTLLRELRGDRFDTTMNYRLRDAVIGFLAPGTFDSKGFADSGHVIAPSDLLARLSSIREDYPDAAYYSLMNLLDSHDTERLLWTLTPGADNATDRELNVANLAAGKARVRLASLIQFTLPGAPTVYYGDEVAITGDDDPDDRRTYPWADKGGSPDTTMLAHYQGLTQLRRALPVLRDGDFRALLADDANGVAAYGRRTGSQAAVVAVNRDGAAHTVSIPVAGYLRDGLGFTTRFALGSGGSAAGTSSGGAVQVTVPANGALVLATGSVDLAPTVAPVLSLAGEGNASLDVSWGAVAGAASYDVWVSPVTGGGYVKVNGSPVTGSSYHVDGLANGQEAFVVVTATDAAGNASAFSNEVSGLPHFSIGWANLQWPPTMTHTISAVNRTDTAYGQVWIDALTSLPGATPGLRAQLGFGPDGSNPDGNAAWAWVDAVFNVDAGNNDEFKASMLPETTGTFDYVYRYSTTNGRDWLYADLNGPIAGGALPSNPGTLTVTPSTDSTAPATPTGLHVVSGSPSTIDIAWDATAGDPTLYGYEVERAGSDGGPWELVARVTANQFTDTTVSEGETWLYRVRSVDASFNRSAPTSPVVGTAQVRTVTLTFNVTVPATTDAAVAGAAGKPVNIAGFLDRLDGSHPQWDPGGTPLSRVDATHWTITFTGLEGTQLEYKYAIGSWDYVEKDAACGEIGNRQLTLSYGSTGSQVVDDTVLDWRNVAPCGS